MTADIKVEFDQEAMKEIFQHALMEQLTEEKRNEIISRAIAFLMTPPKSTSYGGPEQPSPLEIAFRNVLSKAAFEIAQEVVEEHPEIRTRIKEVIGGMVIEEAKGHFDDSTLYSALAKIFSRD